MFVKKECLYATLSNFLLKKQCVCNSVGEIVIIQQQKKLTVPLISGEGFIENKYLFHKCDEIIPPHFRVQKKKYASLFQ